MKQSSLRIALTVCVLPLASWASGPIFQLDVLVHSLKNTSGKVRCRLYASADGFPKEPEKAIATGESLIMAGEAKCRFEKLALGTYAISVMHDEDDDGKMRTGVFGIPREGWGASNDAPAGTFGPPSFDDAKFELKTNTTMRIKVNY